MLRNGTSGQKCPNNWQGGHKSATSANNPRLNGPSNPECRTLRSQRNTSQWYTQTWLAHCRCPTASNTYLQPSTGQHDTWSLNQWRMHQPSHAPKPSSTGGNSTLACQQRSSWIKGERSPANTGKSFRRPWAPSPATHWSITNKPKAWWNGNTKSWSALRHQLLAADRGWHTELPGVLMGLRNMFKSNLGPSAAETTFGSTIIIPGDLRVPMQAELSQKEAKELLGALQREADSWKQNHTIMETFQLCTTLRPQRTQHTCMSKGRKTRQAHSGNALRVPSLSPGELEHTNWRSKWGSQPRAKGG